MTARWTRQLVRRIVPLACVTLAAAACQGNRDGAEFEFHVPVTTSQVEKGTVEDIIEATGTLRAAAEATLTVETIGVLRIARDKDGRRLADGMAVAANQPVAVIEGQDPRLAARLDGFRARFEQARLEYESKRKLFQEGIIDELTFKTVESAMVGARLDLEQAQLTEAKTVIRSPIAGLLVDLARGADGSRLADGQRVQNGLQVAKVIDVGTVTADLDIAGGEVSRVRPGQEVRVSHYALQGEYAGKVARVSPVIDPVTRTFRVEVEVHQKGGGLRPGMFVRARIVAERHEAVPVVPRHAVVTRGGERVVFVVEKQRAVQRRVVLGLGDDENVEIREGLTPGESLVTSGYETLVDGARVRVSSS